MQEGNQQQVDHFGGSSTISSDTRTDRDRGSHWERTTGFLCFCANQYANGGAESCACEMLRRMLQLTTSSLSLALSLSCSLNPSPSHRWRAINRGAKLKVFWAADQTNVAIAPEKPSKLPVPEGFFCRHRRHPAFPFSFVAAFNDGHAFMTLQIHSTQPIRPRRLVAVFPLSLFFCCLVRGGMEIPAATSASNSSSDSAKKKKQAPFLSLSQ